MDANLRTISSALPDLSAPADKKPAATKDLKAESGPSFSSLLKEKETKEPIAVKAKVQNKERVETVAQTEPMAQPQRPFVAKVEGQKEVETPVNVENGKVAIDDKSGVIANSYDSMAVSYPVSRIARESLDEKTVTNLKDQGLWDLPAMTMALPSQQLLMMKDFSGQFDADFSGAESAVPVSKPIAQFMASLENELGVEPDRLVQAFQKLPPGQLALAPEKTMAQVVKNLDLSPKDEARATAIFTKLLSQMEAMSNEGANPALLAAMAGAGLGAQSQVAMPNEKLDDKALVKGRTQAATAKYAKNVGSEKTISVSKEKLPTELSKDFSEKLGEVEPKDFIKEMSSKGPMGKNTVSAEKVEQEVVQEPVQQTSVPSMKAQLESQIQGMTQPQTHSSTPTDMAAVPNVPAHQILSDEKAVKEVTKGIKDVKENLTVKGAEKAQTGATQVSANDFSVAKPDIQAGAAAGGGIANAELKESNNSKQEAVRSIMNQAQMLAQKGGGEVRMTLKPDHLGEIQLKVAMEGNRVNVQMTTERGEVKKLIEQSVHELRHGLASHNLSMDKLDVSVSNRDTSGFRNGQPDFGAAKDFANQFHQQQNSKREFMEDLSALRGNALKSMTTMDRAGEMSKAMSARSASGRLNVVA